MVIQKYIPTGTKRRSGQKIVGPRKIVAHDTGNLNSTATQNVDYYIKTANEVETSAHTFVDDVTIVECIPQTEKAWHVRRTVSDANDWAIAVELCYFTDLERSKTAYKNYVEYIKGLLQKYKLTTADIEGHYKLDPTRRTDPLNAFQRIGKTWEDFIKDLGGEVSDKNKLIDQAIELLQKAKVAL